MNKKFNSMANDIITYVYNCNIHKGHEYNSPHDECIV